LEIETSLKVLIFGTLEEFMAQNPNPETNKDYMMNQWGTKYLITDPKSDQVLREIRFDHLNDIKKQNNLHEVIRNDEDYDDWEYGTEPVYGQSWTNPKKLV